MTWWEEEYKAACERGWQRGQEAALRQAQSPKAKEVSADGKWVILSKAAEIIGRTPQYVRDRLIFLNLVRGDKRNGRWWILLEDAELMAERYRLRQEGYEQNRVLASTKQRPRLPSGWRAKGPAPTRVDIANTPIRSDEIWIKTERAADYLNIRPSTFRWMGIQRKVAHRFTRLTDPENGPPRKGTKKVSEWALSHIHLLMDEREAFASWRCLAPGQHLDNRGKRIIFTDFDNLPPGVWLITVEDAAQMIDVSKQYISQLVARGRLFGWQKIPGKPGCRLYLDGNQVWRYGNSPERLAQRQARQGIKTADPEKEAARMEYLSKLKISPGQKMSNGAKAYKDYGEYYNTVQTAEYLGCTRNAVRILRQHRRLRGYQLNPPDKPYATRGWFFYKKVDVHALAMDASYLEHKARYQKGVQRKQAEEAAKAAQEAELNREWTEEEMKAWQENRQKAPHQLSDAEVLKLQMRNW